MRAPVQKKRPRGDGNAAASTTGADVTGATEPPARRGEQDGPASRRSRTERQPEQPRQVRVRRRLVIAVAVVGVVVLGAAAPAVLTAASQLRESQRLVTLAELNEQAATLAHSLADERDDVTAYIAAGRPDADPGAAGDAQDPGASEPEGSGSPEGAEDPEGAGTDAEGPGESGESGSEATGSGVSERRSARVDRQIDEIRAAAPAGLRDDLDRIADVRRAALTGKSTALEAHTSYNQAVAGLRSLTHDLTRQIPARADDGAHAAAELSGAVEQAAVTRGLLVAALAVPRDPAPQPAVDPYTGLPVPPADDGPGPNDRRRDELSAAAQLARVREEAALADFRQSASPAARDRLGSTVTGPDVTTAEKYLDRLTDQPELSDAELRYNRAKVAASLSARVDQMRGVEAALNAERTAGLERLRDDDVTALEIRVALAGLCLLLAVGVTTGVARSLTRPLAVLRLGSARLAEDARSLPDAGAGSDPAAVPAEPIRFTGRNDEFAQVVRNVNALHERLAAAHDRAAQLGKDRARLIGQRETLAAERAALREQLAEARTAAERLRTTTHSTFVSLSLRTLALVERQLAVIEGLEEREDDPERLATLFKLDHFATVMRRHSENLLVLAGAEHGVQHPGPVPLVDVVRAAVSEIERYERVRIHSLPPHAHLAGFAADDLSHLLAELLENATSFSPPDAQVEVSGWLLESGEVMLSVQDEGIGMTGERLAELNARLAEPDPQVVPGADGAGDPDRADGGASASGRGLGLYVVTRLAARHGVRVQLREQKPGGVTAVVVLPGQVLAAAPAGAVAPPHRAPEPGSGTTRAVTLPGSEAEANSNALRGRSAAVPAPEPGTDVLIAAAEKAVREAGADGDASAPPAPEPAPAPETPDRSGSAPVPETPDRSGSAPVPETPDRREPVLAPGPELPPEAPAAPAAGPAGSPAPAPGPAVPVPPTRTPDAAPPRFERVTDKGLPKRTPKVTTPAAASAAQGGAVDAEALRRRLGGFRQGSAAGRRDAEAELADRADGRTDDAARATAARTEDDSTGETAEEARS